MGWNPLLKYLARIDPRTLSPKHKETNVPIWEQGIEQEPKVKTGHVVAIPLCRFQAKSGGGKTY
jgi:hypothetical protein